MYAADVSKCYQEKNFARNCFLTMAGVPFPRNAELSSQLPEDETEMPSFVLFDTIFPEPPAKRFASLIVKEPLL